MASSYFLLSNSIFLLRFHATQKYGTFKKTKCQIVLGSFWIRNLEQFSSKEA